MLDIFHQLPKPNKMTALYLFEHLRRWVNLITHSVTKVVFCVKLKTLMIFIVKCFHAKFKNSLDQPEDFPSSIYCPKMYS